MDAEQLKILNEIAGLPGIGLSQIYQQLAAAKAMRERARTSKYSSGNSGQVADFGQFMRDSRDLGEASAIPQLEQAKAEMERSMLQQAQRGTQAGIERLADPGPVMIDSFEDQPAQPVATGPDGIRGSGHRAELADLTAMTAGMDPIQSQQMVSKMLMERATEKPTSLAYGAKLVDRRGRELASNDRAPGSGGASRVGLLQVADDYQAANPGASRQDALAYAQRALRGRYASATVANVEGFRDTLTGEFIPNTDIGEVSDNARLVKAAEAGGAVEGKEETTRAWEAPRARVALDGLIAANNDVIRIAEKVKNNPALARSTGLMSLVPSFAGGKAKDVEAYIETLKTKLGFRTLQEMRLNSPTGGALGNVSNTEGEWLRQEAANLAYAQSEEQYIEQLVFIIDHMKGVNERLRKAYAADYETRPAGLNRSRTPAQPAPAGGQTAAERAAALGL
jgi:hypothetical protein